MMIWTMMSSHTKKRSRSKTHSGTFVGWFSSRPINTQKGWAYLNRLEKNQKEKSWRRSIQWKSRDQYHDHQCQWPEWACQTWIWPERRNWSRESVTSSSTCSACHQLTGRYCSTTWFGFWRRSIWGTLTSVTTRTRAKGSRWKRICT